MNLLEGYELRSRMPVRDKSSVSSEMPEGSEQDEAILREVESIPVILGVLLCCVPVLE